MQSATKALPAHPDVAFAPAGVLSARNISLQKKYKNPEKTDDLIAEIPFKR
jgi:hypothetical protein